MGVTAFRLQVGAAQTLNSMNTTAIVTIVSNNYLHFARTLMQSVAQQHPEADRFCVIVDRDAAPAAALTHEFQPLALSHLKLPDGDDFLFQYNILELNTAVKPWALAHLMACGYQNVVYIDPDIVLYRPLDEALALLASGAELVLTPHLLIPIADNLNPTELDIRRAGTYNLGFCALRNGSHTTALLQWWQGKLKRDCIIAHDRGIFVDQSWMDLVPGLFPNVAVLRRPGYNLAYWNLAQRPLTSDQGQILVAGEPLVFFHYSGLNPLAPQAVSKHQNRFTLDKLSSPAQELINDYCQRVQANGLAHYQNLPYGYGQFDDGTPITTAQRSAFRTNDDLRRRARGAPFAIASETNVQVQAVSPLTPDENKTLKQIYAHFLGRSPDESAVSSYVKSSKSAVGHALTVYNVATSREAKAKAGWFQRFLSWPLQGAQLIKPTPFDQFVRQQAPSLAPVAQSTRPSPYGGLHAPEPDSATHGIWVGPRLDLPVCVVSSGRISIKGVVDLGLLKRAGGADFRMDIHGPCGLLHSAPVLQSGPFSLVVTVPQDAFSIGSQWTVMASSHFVPKDIGLGPDTRELAWRVLHVSVDDLMLIDSSCSPPTMAIEKLIAPGGLNLVGYLTAELGLGEAARSLARACVEAEIPFSALDVGFQSQNLQRDTSVLTHAVSDRFGIDLLYVNADQTATTTSYLKGRSLPASYRIGYWHWEQPQLPVTALSAFAHVDEVWVPSTFVHDAVAPYAPVPVVKIPHAISFSPSAGLQRSQFGLPQDKLLVLVMYDFHSYQYRKNPQAAITAFRKAATQRRDVALVIKTINGHHHPVARQELQDSVGDLQQIIFIDEFLTRQQTWDLQACCDILLSLHRAEGFGLVPAEMMYLGKPVIATDWSANTDFMTADNSMPVRYELQTLSHAVGVYPAGQQWAQADTDHAAWCLTRLLDDPLLRQQIGEKAATHIHHHLSPHAVGALVRRRLSLLGFWQPNLRARASTTRG